MIPGGNAACDLHVDQPVPYRVTAHQFPHHKLQCPPRHRHRDRDLAERPLQTIEMGVFVDHPPAGDRHDLVDAVRKLISAILDMDGRLAVWDVTSVDIGEARHGKSDRKSTRRNSSLYCASRMP